MLKSLPMIKVIEPLHLMLLSLKLKDLLEMQPKIKLPETHNTQYLMLKDLLEENSKMILFKKISNYGHSRS